MGIFEQLDQYEPGHQEVVFGYDREVGLKCIIAVHSTVIGPAVGGCRFWNYESEDAAIYDVLRLSRGMSFKNAAANLRLGGGKAVIIGDPKKLKSPEFFKAFAKIVHSLGGTYYTAEDVNISTADIDEIAKHTPYVTGTSGGSANPSPFTARGVYQGIKAVAKMQFGSDSLEGKVVAVQGVGSVGYYLCEYLHKEGAKLKVFDINQDSVKKAVSEFGAEFVDGDIVTTDCDIFAPCALGAILSVDNIPNLKCKAVAGAANNVLVDKAAGDLLYTKGILYGPDYIINAGGIINCEGEVTKDYSIDHVNKKVDEIYDTTIKVLELAKEKNISPYAAADEYAMGIIAAAKKA